MIIKKGDEFLCIETVIMDDGEIAYIKDRIYKSEQDGCITNEQQNTGHSWGGIENKKYFTKTGLPYWTKIEENNVEDSYLVKEELLTEDKINKILYKVFGPESMELYNDIIKLKEELKTI